MVTIKDGCGCDPCDCDWKQKLKEAYSRAIQSVNKIGDNDGSVYFPDGTGFVKLPLPRQSDVAQIHTNTEDIADLKVRNTQLQADINAETTAREEAITAEASARETAITAEATAREEAISAEASARETAITAEATAREEAISAEASAREAKDTELDADIARIDNTDTAQDQRIQNNADRITTINNDLTATEATVTTHNTEIINLQSQTEALSKSIVSDVMMTDGTTAGSVQVSIEKEDGAIVTSANYKWGRDIGVRLEAGTQAGYIKTVISLSDGTELESNEYKIVEVLESDVYVTAITLVPDMTAGTIGGNISYSNGTTQTINAINVPTAPGVTSAIETLQSRMTAVEQNNTTQDSQIGSLQSRMSAVEQKNTTQDSQIGSLQSSMSAVEQKNTTQDSQIGTLQSRMSAVEQKNTTQDSQISAIDARVKAIEDTPGVGQFAAGKLGTIAGSTADGRVKAEDDGTGSVNGWSDLKSRVSTAESQIVSAQNGINALNGTVAQQTTDISSLMTDITNLENKNTAQDTAIAGKVAISQGTGNAGKALVVGSDGNVTPGEISGGEVWEEVDLTNFPTDWQAGDRVKVQTKVYLIINSNTTGTSSWSTAPTKLTIDKSNKPTPDIVEFAITSSTEGLFAPLYIKSQSSAIGIICIDVVQGPTGWNGSVNTLFIIDGIVFNGAGRYSTTISVTRNNVKDYIYKMWRLKK